MSRFIRFAKDVVNDWLEADAFTLAAALGKFTPDFKTQLETGQTRSPGTLWQMPTRASPSIRPSWLTAVVAEAAEPRG